MGANDEVTDRGRRERGIASRLDPPCCECTDCLVDGHSKPIDAATDEELAASVLGFVDNASGCPVWAGFPARCSKILREVDRLLHESSVVLVERGEWTVSAKLASPWAVDALRSARSVCAKAERAALEQHLREVASFAAGGALPEGESPQHRGLREALAGVRAAEEALVDCLPVLDHLAVQERGDSEPSP